MGLRKHPLILPLSVQLAHLLLSCAWNLFGVYLIANGEPAPGPTASLAAVAIMATIATALVLGVLRFRWLYATGSLVTAVLTLPAIIGAFTRDPSLWPSETWRLGGVMLNSVGVLAAIWGLALCLRLRRADVSKTSL